MKLRKYVNLDHGITVLWKLNNLNKSLIENSPRKIFKTNQLAIVQENRTMADNKFPLRVENLEDFSNESKLLEFPQVMAIFSMLVVLFMAYVLTKFIKLRD